MVQLQPDPPGNTGGVAQLGEHLLCKQGVIGSIPFTSTIDVERLEPSEWGCLLGSGFLSQGLFRSLTIRKKYNHTHLQFGMVWLGLDCMYRLIAIEEFDGNQEQHKR